MNLPTVVVTDYDDTHGPVVEAGPLMFTTIHDQIGTTLPTGTYALVRVADGQTVTAENVWWCEVVDRPVEDCDLDDKYHRRAESHRVVSVLLVRGAADE